MLRAFIIFYVLICCHSVIAADLNTQNHFINTQSIAPALLGKPIQLYLHEVSPNDKRKRQRKREAVLFIHGSGTPSQPAFDLPYKDYSWMAYLAKAGFSAYALDLTGYGRSTRPPEMDNPCNLPEREQQQFIPSIISKPCANKHNQALTSNESDRADMDTAVNFILEKEKLNSVSLIGWSQGGPRALIYTLLHPEKVKSLVLLAPAYNREWPLSQTPNTELSNLFFSTNRTEFNKGWDKQLGCPNQVDMEARESAWKEILASDTTGATWGTGVRRAPEQIWRWGFNASLAAKINKPTLLIIGEFDKQVNPQRVQELYEDLASSKKVFLQLGCSSHFANWETRHLLLFQSSAEWIQKNRIEHQDEGIKKLGYRSAQSNSRL